MPRECPPCKASFDKISSQEPPQATLGPEQYLILITCRDEHQQVQLLARFQGEGLESQALLG